MTATTNVHHMTDNNTKLSVLSLPINGTSRKIKKEITFLKI